MFKIFKNRIFTIALISLFVLASGGFGLYVLKRNSQPQLEPKTQTSNQNTIENTSENQNTANQNINQLNFTLFKDEGEVLYKKTPNEEYQSLTQDQLDLPSNTFIKTQSASQAHTILPDNSMVSIDESSELQIVLTDKKTDILQNAGNTWHRIQKLGDGSSYDVKTSNTLATVRGTIFGVKNNFNQATEVYVLDSKVQVQQYEDEKSQKLTQVSELVQAGKHALIPNFKDKNKIDLTDILDEKKNTVWFQKNRILDEEFQKGNKPSEILKKLKEDPDLKNRILKLKELNQGTVNPTNTQALKPVTNITKPSPTTTKIDALKILGLNSTDCQEFDATSAEVNLKQAVDTKQISGKNIDLMIAYLDKIKQICGTDSGATQEIIPKLTLESPTITTNITTTTTQTTTLPSTSTSLVATPTVDPSFQTEVKAKFDYYTTYYIRDTKTFCSIYNQSSVDAILGEFTALEKKYNVSSTLADKYRPLIYTIAVSCRDNIITSSENTSIEVQKGKL